MISLQIIFFIYFMAKRFKPIRNFMLVFEPFDPRIDPPNPPKYKSKINMENKKSNLFTLFDDNVNNNNDNQMSKKEKEIRKSILINQLLNRNKNKSKKNDIKNEDDNYDNALVVHYENTDEDSEESDEYPEDKYSDNYSNYSKSEDSKDYKKNKSLKIYNRNLNKDLKGIHIFSKETIIPEFNKNKNKNKKKAEDIYHMNTLDSGDISPRNSRFNHYNEVKTFKKKGKEITIDNSDERKEEETNIKINNKHSIKNKNKNQITLRNTLKNRNARRRRLNNVLSSKDDLISDNKFKSKNKKLQETNSLKYFHKNQLTSQEESKKTESALDSSNKPEDKNKEKELGNMRLKFKKVNYSLTYEEINDLDFDKALVNDTRSFWRIFLSYLLQEHIIINTFCTDAYLELRAIKLSFLVFGYEISFFLNALFYTDEYISDTYHNDGVLDFFSSLPKSIYSFIVTLVISNLLKMLSSSKKQLNKIIEERQDKKEYLAAVEKELKRFKNKIIWYFIIVFILSIFFAYYVAAFCAVYQNSQNFWLIGCLESSVLDFLTPFLICLVLSSLRYIGLKKRSKCSYNTAKYLGLLM